MSLPKVDDDTGIWRKNVNEELIGEIENLC